MTTIQATLQTARLRLAPLQREQLDLTMKLETDARVMKYIAFGRPFTETEATQFHNWLVDTATMVPGFGTWVGFSQAGEYVGWWMLAPILKKDDPKKFENDCTEYGFRVVPEFWGQGYAKEGAQELVRHAFEDLGLGRVTGETMTVNEASRKVMAACGLRLVETFFNEYESPPPGHEEGEVRYAMTKPEYFARRQQD